MKKFLIVGLGNIGAEYTHTRHNIGFQILDHFVLHHELKWETVKLGDRAEYKIKGRTFVLLKPSTYVNLSGKAVLYHLSKEKLNSSQLLVITDDLNLPFGTLRLKSKGSDGGHNGLKNIEKFLNTSIYPRLRFGISNVFSKGQQIDHVLGQWSEEEHKLIPERLNKSLEIIPSFGLSGMAQTMNLFNGK